MANQLRHAGDRMIPTTTVLKDEQLPMVEEAIEDRAKALKKLKYRDVEASLWLMEEIEHLKELLCFNKSFRETSL